MRLLKAELSGARDKGKGERPGVRMLGLGGDDSMAIVRQVRAGFPFSRLARFQKTTELPWETVSRFVAIPQRTITRRQGQGRLRPDESDRVWRASAIFDMAMDLFEGDVIAARQWLLTPQAGLGGEVPLEFASTEVGSAGGGELDGPAGARGVHVRVHGVRIVKAKHAGSAFTGEGAKRFGGRWNMPGVAVVYVAGSASLAILEMLVHLGSHELMKQYVMFEMTFEDSLVTAIDPAGLPKSWRRSPAPAAVQRIGSVWAAGGVSAVLRVPSSIVPSEWNYLLNPGHSDFGKIKIGARQAVRFDPRLIKRSGS